mmetsp:Transcript_9780/g.20462  ORF Transcript_9780/g.20462 Transcript_9780/m.20462 type:complete len:781 (+) Transcript_9780:44-2386(+)
MEDARKQDETLQAVESLARQLLQSRFQCRVAGEFFSQLGSGATALNEKENVAPKVRLQAPGLPLRELSPFPHEKNRRNRPADAALMSSIDSTTELKQSLASLQRQLASLAREEEALAKEMKKFEAPREHSIRYLMMNEELEREEQQLWHLRAEQLKPSPSGPSAPSAEAALRAGRAEAADLQRVSEDLAAELATRQREQRRLEGERQQLETHCSRLAGRLQLQRQMARNLRDGCSEALPSGTEDISAVEAEVIQLLHAAMACLAGKRPGGFPQNLVQSCQMAKSIVDGFRRELLMLLNDLCGSEMLREGASCRSLVFSVCDALRDAVLRAKGRKAPLGERGSMGTLQSTQRLVVLLQQQEEELSECLSKLKPLPVKPAAHASRPVAVKQRSPEKLGNAYPESLASTPYAEQLPSGSPKPSSPGLQQIVANAQRLQQLLELRGAAGATGATAAGAAGAEGFGGAFGGSDFLASSVRAPAAEAMADTPPAKKFATPSTAPTRFFPVVITPSTELLMFPGMLATLSTDCFTESTESLTFLGTLVTVSTVEVTPPTTLSAVSLTRLGKLTIASAVRVTPVTVASTDLAVRPGRLATFVTTLFTPSTKSSTFFAVFPGSLATYSAVACTFPGNLARASPVLTTASDAREAPLLKRSGSSMIPVTVFSTPSAVSWKRLLMSPGIFEMFPGIFETFSMTLGPSTFFGFGAFKFANLSPAPLAAEDTSLKGRWNFSPSSEGTAFRLPRLSFNNEACVLMFCAWAPMLCAVLLAAWAAFPGASTTSCAS